MGTGLRGTVDAMDGKTAARIRDRNIGWVRDHRVQSVEINVIYAVAKKGGLRQALQSSAAARCKRSTARTDRWCPELPRSGSQRSTPTIDPKRTLTLTFESGSLVRARIAGDAHHQLSAILSMTSARTKWKCSVA